MGSILLSRICVSIKLLVYLGDEKKPLITRKVDFSRGSEYMTNVKAWYVFKAK